MPMSSTSSLARVPFTHTHARARAHLFLLCPLPRHLQLLYLLVVLLHLQRYTRVCGVVKGLSLMHGSMKAWALPDQPINYAPCCSLRSSSRELTSN